MGPEDIEATIVHIGQKLGRALRQTPLTTADLDPPGLPPSGAQIVAKGLEFDLQLLAVPRNEDRILQRHELMVT